MYLTACGFSAGCGNDYEISVASCSLGYWDVSGNTGSYSICGYSSSVACGLESIEGGNATISSEDQVNSLLENSKKADKGRDTFSLVLDYLLPSLIGFFFMLGLFLVYRYKKSVSDPRALELSLESVKSAPSMKERGDTLKEGGDTKEIQDIHLGNVTIKETVRKSNTGVISEKSVTNPLTSVRIEHGIPTLTGGGRDSVTVTRTKKKSNFNLEDGGTEMVSRGTLKGILKQ
jgi:hypothetical protein